MNATKRIWPLSAVVIIAITTLRPLAAEQADIPTLAKPNSHGSASLLPSFHSSNEESWPGSLFQWSSNKTEGGPPGWDEPLASDRPDFTEASTTAGRGVRQLEIGYAFFTDDDGTKRMMSHSFPELLLRAGVWADWLEVRVGWNYASEDERINFSTTTVSGAEDLYLGLKLGLTSQDGILPEMALVPQMTVPTGHSAYRSEKILPGVNWLYGWEISEFLCTAGSTQFNLAQDEVTGREYLQYAQSWTVGYTLSEYLGAFTEWFMFSPAGASTAQTEHYLNMGLSYRFSNDLQFDVRIGKGVSAAAVDMFTGAGVAVRF